MSWLGELLSDLAEWIVSSVAALVQGLFDGLRAMGEAELALVRAGIEAAGADSASVMASEWWAKINIFFPLSETLAFATAYLGAWLGIAAYRLVKSWLPTVAT